MEAFRVSHCLFLWRLAALSDVCGELSQQAVEVPVSFPASKVAVQGGGIIMDARALEGEEQLVFSSMSLSFSRSNKK